MGVRSTDAVAKQEEKRRLYHCLKLKAHLKTSEHTDTQLHIQLHNCTLHTAQPKPCISVYAVHACIVLATNRVAAK